MCHGCFIIVTISLHSAFTDSRALRYIQKCIYKQNMLATGFLEAVDLRDCRIYQLRKGVEIRAWIYLYFYSYRTNEKLRPVRSLGPRSFIPTHSWPMYKVSSMHEPKAQSCWIPKMKSWCESVKREMSIRAISRVRFTHVWLLITLVSFSHDPTRGRAAEAPLWLSLRIYWNLLIARFMLNCQLHNCLRR